MTAPERVCRRCLLRDDPSQQDMYRTVSEYVASMPSNQRADACAVKARLEACAKCERLQSGICRLCGCYVEARAAKRRAGCPDLPARWAE